MELTKDHSEQSGGLLNSFPEKTRLATSMHTSKLAENMIKTISETLQELHRVRLFSGGNPVLARQPVARTGDRAIFHRQYLCRVAEGKAPEDQQPAILARSIVHQRCARIPPLRRASVQACTRVRALNGDAIEQIADSKPSPGDRGSSCETSDEKVSRQCS